jgi:hypothetical protein
MPEGGEAPDMNHARGRTRQMARPISTMLPTMKHADRP